MTVICTALCQGRNYAPAILRNTCITGVNDIFVHLKIPKSLLCGFSDILVRIQTLKHMHHDDVNSMIFQLTVCTILMQEFLVIYRCIPAKKLLMQESFLYELESK